MQYTLELTFEEAIFGTQKEVEVTRNEVCERCNGSRAEPGTSPEKCSTCGGQGEVRQTRQTIFGSMVQVTTCPNCRGAGETISTPCTQCNGRGLERNTSEKVVTIPAGVDTGNQMRLAGEGQPGIHGGPPGDLYLTLKVKSHKYFKRRNQDILLDLKINVAQATLGAEVEVPTVDGSEKMTIPPGTQPGKVIKLRGKGVPHIRSNSRGDQLVIINVQVPTRLNERQQELFKELAESLGTEVRPQGPSLFDKIVDFLAG